MTRCLSVLLMLLAQVTAMVSPVLLRHCVSADGQYCIEFQGENCDCCVLDAALDHESECGSLDENSEHEHESPASCCSGCAVAQSDVDGPDATTREPSISAVDGCDCEHSRVEHLQLAARQIDLAAQFVSLAVVFDTALRPAIVSVNVATPHVELRPDPDAHLAVMAVIVLRV